MLVSDYMKAQGYTVLGERFDSGDRPLEEVKPETVLTVRHVAGF
jgi:hypothetical protein